MTTLSLCPTKYFKGTEFHKHSMLRKRGAYSRKVKRLENCYKGASVPI
jgi:hypothetical protein